MNTRKERVQSKRLSNALEMKSLDVFLVQMFVKFGNKAANYQKVVNLLTEANLKANPDVFRVIALPELFSTGYDLQNHKKHAENIPKGLTTDYLKKLAIKFDAAVVASYIEHETGFYYNTAVIINRKGEFIGKYRKIHLFPLNPLDETKVLTEGGFLSEKPIFELEWGKIGVLICFDIRFPEISRLLAKSGAEILFYLAEFPDPRRIAWKCLLQARAIENQIYICGVNRVGKDPKSGGGAKFFGYSRIIDPSGNILIEGDESESVLHMALDPESLDEAKKSFDSLKHRKEHHYY
ncbi:MAG: carbon-nitrogen family hydrolase [Candidatus Heimdallarchaeota archaeon]|nr:carbon-nitrogen family hydrolase [Candidatus Heimdallarchaeota archaeon]